MGVPVVFSRWQCRTAVVALLMLLITTACSSPPPTAQLAGQWQLQTAARHGYSAPVTKIAASLHFTDTGAVRISATSPLLQSMQLQDTGTYTIEQTTQLHIVMPDDTTTLQFLKVGIANALGAKARDLIAPVPEATAPPLHDFDVHPTQGVYDFAITDTYLQLTSRDGVRATYTKQPAP